MLELSYPCGGLAGSLPRSHSVLLVACQGLRPWGSLLTAFQPLLDKLDIEGKVITADAIHAHDDNAKYIVEEKKGDYLFEIKGINPLYFKTLKLLKKRIFPPEYKTI
jgi:hypothetical protein